MEFWTLDSQLRKASVIEGYESFIWTERRSAWGDFEIHMAATQSARSLLPAGTMLGMSLSTYMMTVETITDTVGDDGAENLKITGRSLEAILDDRIAMSTGQVSDIVTNPKWVLTDTPGNIIRAVFQYICVDVSLDSGDVIPFYHSGTILPAGSITESSETIVANLDPTTVYTVAKTIADTYGLGFRLVRNGETSQVYFEVYTGDDRTSDQTSRDAVIFSPNLDSLSNVSKLTSNSAYKNLAYVIGKDQVKIVFGVGEDTTASGFARRVLVVNATNIDATNVTDVDSALSQAGLDALSSHRKIYQFDGQIPEIGPYQYGVHYKLGDLVEEQDATGFGNQMYVTEQIFVSDQNGDRSYPTLTLSEVIVPGTWIDVDPPTEEWADVATDQVWGNQ
jgi:hypothetical protein